MPKIALLFFYVSILNLFVFQVQKVEAVDITDTESVSITAIVGGLVVTPPAGGGSSYTEPIEIPKTAVQFSGLAYPFAPVIITKQGKEITRVTADGSGVFSATLPEKYDSTVLYSVQARDTDGNRSLLLNYPIVVRTGYVTHLSGILFAPTIVTDKSEVKEGDYLSISGFALSNKEITLNISGLSNKTFNINSNTEGRYSITAPLVGLTKGQYSVTVSYRGDTRMSKLVNFIIGDKNVLLSKEVENIPGDCNKDGIINLIDFSILAFWYKKLNPPICVDTNQDNTINLVDFSILAFYWNG